MKHDIRLPFFTSLRSLEGIRPWHGPPFPRVVPPPCSPQRTTKDDRDCKILYFVIHVVVPRRKKLYLLCKSISSSLFLRDFLSRLIRIVLFFKSSTSPPRDFVGVFLFGKVSLRLVKLTKSCCLLVFFSIYYITLPTTSVFSVLFKSGSLWCHRCPVIFFEVASPRFDPTSPMRGYVH